MVLEEILKDSMIGKIETLITEIEEDIKFVNVSNNKWQAVISFDLDATKLTVMEKEALSALLRHL